MKGTKINFNGREYNTDGDRPVELDDVPKINSEKELKKILRDRSLVFLQVGDKELFGINRLKFKRQIFLMLEPNPVTFYFSLAFDVVRQLEDARNRLTGALNESLIATIRKKTSEDEKNILFIKWDRFSRNIEYAYEMIGILRKYHTTAMSIDQPIDFSVPESTVMLAVYLSILRLKIVGEHSIHLMVFGGQSK